MTRITAIRLSTHVNEIGGKVWNPAIRWTSKHAVFVEIETRDGRVGLGECWCFDSSPKPLLAFLETELVPAVLGRDLDELDRIRAAALNRATLTARHGMLASAMSGIDIAAWDLRAQGSGRPLHRLLGERDAAEERGAEEGEGDGTVLLYGSGGLYGQDKDEAALAAEMAGLARHHDIVKMKIGALSVEADLARIHAVLEALPTDRKLIVDAVYSYDPATALRVYRALPADRIEAFQSPVAAHDIAGMAWLTERDVPVMAVEAEYRAELHDLLVARRAVRFLQVAPVACGGISRVAELARQVAGGPVALSLEVSSTAVALMAAAHCAAAFPQVAHVECHGLHDVFFDRLPLPRHPGRSCLPAAPGLGIALPRDAVEAQGRFTAPTTNQKKQTNRETTPC